MQTGIVKWFNNAKGYGFILSDFEKLEVFVHYSVIEMNGYKSLKAGQYVVFESTKDTKGFSASFVKIINDFSITNLELSHNGQKETKEEEVL